MLTRYSINQIHGSGLLKWILCLGTILFYGLSFNPLQAFPFNPSSKQKQQKPASLEDQVIKIFQKNCTLAGCHTGSSPLMGLKLTEEEFYSRTVNQPSLENPDLLRVKPGDPDNSYLVMKILGEKGIIGSRMPFGRDPLSQDDIAVITGWIKSLTSVDSSRIAVKTADPLLPFNAWKIINVPTTRMIDAKNWLFLIGHRFFPPLDSGYDGLYGLDGSSAIFFNLGYAITDKLFVNLGRSNSSDNVELDIKYGLKQQFPKDKLPFAVAVQTSVNWISEKSPGKNRLRSEALKPSFQAILSSQVAPGIGINAAPGILFNPDSDSDGEDPLITLGLGGRVHVWKSISLIAEWSPIVSGYILTSTLGELNRFDTWGGGIELSVGGHAFQIFVTNSAGITTDQYMRGGSFDIENGDVRLGFNIFRMLQF